MDFFFTSIGRLTRFDGDWSSDVCSSDLDEFLRVWVPLITASPAFKDGLLVITFDEADIDPTAGPPSDPEVTAKCCAGFPSPNTPMPGIYGQGGGDRKSTRLNSSHSQISY